MLRSSKMLRIKMFLNHQFLLHRHISNRSNHDQPIAVQKGNKGVMAWILNNGKK